MNDDLLITEIALEKSHWMTKGKVLEIVKLYFLTLSRFRKFVIANRKELDRSIKQHVTLYSKETSKDFDLLSIQRDCLVLKQVAKQFAA